MRVVNRGSRANPEYWIVGVPAYEADGESHTECGPYSTRSEAEDDRLGLEKSYIKLDDTNG